MAGGSSEKSPTIKKKVDVENETEYSSSPDSRCSKESGCQNKHIENRKNLKQKFKNKLSKI